MISQIELNFSDQLLRYICIHEDSTFRHYFTPKICVLLHWCIIMYLLGLPIDIAAFLMDTFMESVSSYV
jgi:hypothetical protein